MMAYQPKDNTGSLFKNDKKETDSHPNARGSALIDGVEYWVDAWTNEVQSGDNAGQKYQALKFKRKDTARAPTSQPQRRTPTRDDDDGRPPF